MTMIEKKTIHCTAFKKNPHGAIGTSNRKTRHNPAVDAEDALENLKMNLHRAIIQKLNSKYFNITDEHDEKQWISKPISKSNFDRETHHETVS